jgi:hypothetical protein
VKEPKEHVSGFEAELSDLWNSTTRGLLKAWIANEGWIRTALLSGRKSFFSNQWLADADGSNVGIIENFVVSTRD